MAKEVLCYSAVSNNFVSINHGFTFQHDRAHAILVIEECFQRGTSYLPGYTEFNDWCLNWSIHRILLRASMDQKMNVYIWDMDETLILLKSLLNGTYAGAFNGLKNVEDGVKIGKLWENHILQVCDTHFFYQQVSIFLSYGFSALICLLVLADMWSFRLKVSINHILISWTNMMMA